MLKNIFVFVALVFFFIGCGGGEVKSTSINTNSSTTQTTTSSSSTSSSTNNPPTLTISNLVNSQIYQSETTILKNSFVSDLENWSVSYNGACTLSFSATVNQENNGSLFVTNRAHEYDGPFLNITSKLQPNQLYVIRGYLKQTLATTNTYRLMVKIGTLPIEYRELNRINVIDTNWNKFRAFVSFTQDELNAGAHVYVNSDSNINDFYLDSFEIAKTNYIPANDDSSEDILQISGKDIINKNNTVMKLKGINVTAYDDEDGNTNDQSASKFINYSYYNYDKDDFKNIASMGFNAIRINLWYRYFEDESNPYVYKEDGFVWLDTIIGWAKEAGIYVMLDMHAPQGGGFQGPNNITAFWNTTSYQDRFKSLWREIARRYKNSSTVAAYDIINEPCANTQAQYVTLLSDTITQIRQIDTNHIVNVENGFSSDNEPFILAHNNILYDFHFYDPWDSYTNHLTSVYGTNGIDATQMRTLFEDYTDYYSLHNVPFNVSEFGQERVTFTTKNGLGWVSDLIDLINEKNGNYFYFSYKGNEFSIYDSKNSFFENVDSNTPLIELFKAKQN